MTCFASPEPTAAASSEVGTFSTVPDFNRFMLLSMNACGLPRNSETSIWSSDTPERCVREATRDSVSPGRTWYSSIEPFGAADAAGAAAVAGGRGAGATGAAAFDADAAAVAAGAGAGVGGAACAG